MGKETPRSVLLAHRGDGLLGRGQVASQWTTANSALLGAARGGRMGWKVSSESSPWQRKGGNCPEAVCLLLCRRGKCLIDFSFIAPSLSVATGSKSPPTEGHSPFSSAPGLLALSMPVPGGVTAAPSALAPLCRANHPMLLELPLATYLDINTTWTGNTNSFSADRDLPQAILEDMGKVPETGQQLHHSVSMEK